LSTCDPRDEVARCFRADGGRTVATLSRLLGAIDLAEDALQEAYVTALERWPRDGFPTRPFAWILTTARNAALNRLHRERTGREKAQRAALLERALAASDAVEDDAVTELPDDRLGMIFACCHPALSVESRIALTLRTLAGLTTLEIADALQPSPVIALNRAVAIGFARGPTAALAVLDALPRHDLDGFHHFHLARADALNRLGRLGEAVAAYEAALSRTQNTAQQRHLRSLIASASGA
jgi:predicted RNA polymerase sigma factor